MDPSDRLRSIHLSNGKRQFRQPPLDAVRLDIREVLTVYPRCALIGAALGIGMSQNVVAVPSRAASYLDNVIDDAILDAIAERGLRG